MIDDLIVSRRANLLEAEVDGELVALDVEGGTCFGFNVTATQIWRLTSEPISAASIRDSLLEEFDIDSETCEEQLLEVLGQLEKDGLIETRRA